MRDTQFVRAQAFGSRPRRGRAVCIMVNGWYVESRPNSFAERYRWTAIALDAEGYLTAKEGFQTKREAVAYAETHAPPTVREPLA